MYKSLSKINDIRIYFFVVFFSQIIGTSKLFQCSNFIFSCVFRRQPKYDFDPNRLEFDLARP